MEYTLHKISQSTIQQLATQVGFDACGICQAKALTFENERLREWIGQGMHGEMTYMERNIEKRIDPTLLVPGAKSIISLLLNYYPGNPPITTQPPKISRYALSVDYHKVLKQMLWQMLDLLRKEFGEISGRAFVDSAPVLERAWAQKAGLGWIGKNGLLINQKIGTYTFIGELIVDADIEPSTSQVPNRCGTCSRCMDACPTGAIVEPGVVDARRCISYLTIERKTPLAEVELKNLNSWCFGCDTCQEVCPWNNKLPAHQNLNIQPKDKITELSGEDLVTLSEEDFDRLFKDTAISRTGYEHFMINCTSVFNK
jgi:epoxyqueuosine reductase